MPFASTAPLRREIEARIPERPFTVEFWDGTRLPSSDGDGPTFYVRSPRAAAHVAARARPARARPRLRQRRDRGRRHRRGDRAARQLGAAGAGERRQARACCSARCAPPASPGRRAGRPPSCAPAASRHSKERDAARGAPPLRRLQRVLLALPRRVDDLQLRDLLARARRPSRRRRKRSWRRSPASWR